MFVGRCVTLININRVINMINLKGLLELFPMNKKNHYTYICNISDSLHNGKDASFENNLKVYFLFSDIFVRCCGMSNITSGMYVLTDAINWPHPELI